MRGITAAILFLALSRVLEKTDVRGKSMTYCILAFFLSLVSVFLLIYALVSLCL
jgi:hypothetical protein